MQDILKSQNELSDGVVTFKSDTLPASYEVFRNSIDKPIYNKVRNILSQSNEGILSEYNN